MRRWDVENAVRHRLPGWIAIGGLGRTNQWSGLCHEISQSCGMGKPIREKMVQHSSDYAMYSKLFKDSESK